MSTGQSAPTTRRARQGSQLVPPIRLRLAFLVTASLSLVTARDAEAGNPHTECGDTTIDIGGADVIYQALHDNGPGKVGPRRLVVDQMGTIRSMTSRLFVQHTPTDLDRQQIRIRKTGGRARTVVTICSTDRGGHKQILHQFEIGKGNANIGHVWTKQLTGVAGKRISVRLVGKHATNSMSYELELIRPNRGAPRVPNKSLRGAARNPVVGLADLHNHHSSNWGFGGGVIAGGMNGPERSPSCTDAHARKKNFTAGLVVGGHPREGTASAATPSTYKTGHGHHCSKEVGETTRCWSDTTHNKMSKPALKLAHDHGLKLMVTHVVSNQALCYLAAPLKKRDLSCSDMESAKLQLLKLKEFARANPWYTIVTDPWEARRAIARGELAVVIGLEVSNIFPSSDGNYIKQLHDIYDMGASVVYLAHESDSDFAGVAYHHWPTLLVNQELKLLKNALTGKGHGALFAQFNPAVDTLAKGESPLSHNTATLSSRGRNLVKEMMRLNMLIDIDHLSRPSIDAVYELAKNNNFYPLFAGHTRVTSLLNGKTRKVTMELAGTAKVFNKIADTGGVLALRMGPDDIKSYGTIPNDCMGSVKSFLQTYQWIVDKGYSVALGSDFNGYVPMIGPRWGPDACPLMTNDKARARQRRAQGAQPQAGSNSPPGWEQYGTRGLVDIGLLPAVLHDMKSLGADTEPLEHSAEAFLRMWERSYDPKRRKAFKHLPGGPAKLPTAPKAPSTTAPKPLSPPPIRRRF